MLNGKTSTTPYCRSLGQCHGPVLSPLTAYILRQPVAKIDQRLSIKKEGCDKNNNAMQWFLIDIERKTNRKGCGFLRSWSSNAWHV